MMDGEIVQINNLTSSNIGDLNPFRYRSYYYDTETGYYYLNSRYYDSNVGRFLNEDVYASTGQGILGHNMFAYCQNNPILFVDSTGTRIVMADLGVAISSSEPKIKTAGVSVTNTSKSNSKFMADVKNANLLNTDEQKVIDANYFSFYKGILYIIVPNERAGFSFGVVFYGENQQSKNLVRHEYGHTVQFRKKGPAEYIGNVIIPSVLVYWLLYERILLGTKNIIVSHGKMKLIDMVG